MGVFCVTQEQQCLEIGDSLDGFHVKKFLHFLLR